MSDSTGPVVPKPTLPHGWSCHLSKSVPGISYYFNRFTGAKTWDIGEIIPGHSDRPAQALVAGSAEQSIFVRDQQQRPAAPNTHQLSSGSHQMYRQQHPVQPPTHRRHPSLQGHNQHARRPRLAGPPLDPVAGCSNSEFLGDEMTSLGVAELEALLAEKKRKLEEMARRHLSNVNCSADSSSVESGFVSLVGREDEGGLGKDMSDRQKELTERGGLYRDWGDGVTHGSKRVKIDFDNNVVKTDKVNCDELEAADIDEPVINDENDNIANQVEVKDENNIDSDSDSHDNESLCGADPEELAALASLDKKFSVDRATHSSSAAALSVPQSSSSPPELLLWDNDCKFSPEPESNEEESSEG